MTPTTEPDFTIPIGNHALCPKCVSCWTRSSWEAFDGLPTAYECDGCLPSGLDDYIPNGHLTDWLTAGLRAASLGVTCKCMFGTLSQLYSPTVEGNWAARHLCGECRSRPPKPHMLSLEEVGPDAEPQGPASLSPANGALPCGCSEPDWFSGRSLCPEHKAERIRRESDPVTLADVVAGRRELPGGKRREPPASPPQPPAASVSGPHPCAGSPGGAPGPQNPDMGETGLPAGQDSEQGRREFGAPRDWYIDGLIDNFERRALMAAHMVPLTGPPHPPVAEANAPTGAETDQVEALDWERSLTAMTESPKPPGKVTTMSTAKPSAALTRRRHIDEAKRVLDGEKQGGWK